MKASVAQARASIESGTRSLFRSGICIILPEIRKVPRRTKAQHGPAGRERAVAGSRADGIHGHHTGIPICEEEQQSGRFSKTFSQSVCQKNAAILVHDKSASSLVIAWFCLMAELELASR